jgi:uncharacterized membrane protein YGL010W
VASSAELYAEYGSFHKDSRNLVCHEIGIPLIILSIFSLLALVRVGPVDLGAVVGALVLVYYFSLDARTAMVATVLFVLLYLAAKWIWWPYAVAAFVVGWVFQFVGHRYEGQSPAFTKNLLHLLVGPLWLCSHVVGARGRAA